MLGVSHQLVADFSSVQRVQIDAQLGWLCRRLSIHFSLSFKPSAALTMNRQFDFFSCESRFDWQRLFPQMLAPNVTCKKHLQCSSKRHGEEGTDHPANNQAPG